MATKASRIALAGSNISSTGEVDADLLDNIDSAAFLSLDSNGRLGIGTDNPTVPLHIVSSSTSIARFVGSNVGNLYITNDSDNVMTLQASTNTALSFNTDGANERMRIDASGNVGIGTDSPAHKLHINQPGNSPQLRIQGTSNTYDFYSYSDNNLYINNPNGTILGLLANKDAYFGKNLSIGDSVLSTYHANYPALDIGSSASVQGYTGNNGAWLQSNLFYNTNGQWTSKSDDYSAMLELYDGNFNFYNTASGTGTRTLLTPMTIRQNGRVGIGTTSPSTLLHVDGNTTLDGQVTIEGDVTINTNAKQFNFESDQERDNIYWSRNGVAHFFVIHATNGDLVFRNHASNNATGQINFESTIQVGNTAITAANAGAGALKYDNVLQISNGTDWKAVRMIGQDGSSSANAFDDLVEVAGLHSSDTSLWTTVQGYVSGGLQYTVDFTTPFTPKYQATNSNSGTYSTSGTFGGCSQGTGTGWTVWDAASYCMRGGARLCSLTELDANVVGGSGCSHDNRAIWTYTTNSNGHFYRGSGINSNSLNEGYVVGTNTSPTGYSINEIGVRCCGTSASGGALWEI
jgi:hypothetical protein